MGASSQLGFWRRLRRRIFLFGSLGILILAVAGFVGVLITYNMIAPASVEEADVWERKRVYGLKVLDKNGDLLARRGAFHGDIVRLHEMPAYLPAAFIATEDRRFYQHGPVDPIGLTRAFLTNQRAGRTVQGGSSITQQLAKNLFLSSDRTYTRKFKELFYAVWLERHLSKDEILTLYLNRIYMGASTYGIDAAARFYFDVSAREVTVSQAAMLAGLPKAPSRYAPTSDLVSAQARASVVLDNLVKAKILTKDEAEAARDNPATPKARKGTDGQNYFIDFVATEVKRLVGSPSVNITVHTTLDPKLQRLAEVSVENSLANSGQALEVQQAAAVTLDLNGAVRAMVGGRNYFESQFNRAVQAKRQPGSAFKPFVYLTALEQGIKTDSVWEDSPTRIGKWAPTNYSRTYSGRVTMRMAFEKSINTVAAKIAQEVGTDEIIKTAHRLGIRSPLTSVPSIALGTEEVSLLELTSAYTPFATLGTATERHAVLRVTTNTGEVLYDFPAAASVRVIEPEIATAMNHLMYQVIYRGTGTKASLGNRPAAGKTGTSQDWRDAWFVGYTQNYVTGVWIGNDDATPTNHASGGSLPAIIWKDIMMGAHQGVQVKQMPGAVPAHDGERVRDLVSFLETLTDDFRQIENENRRSSKKKKKKKIYSFPWSD
jgi:penicillin-binding protein 1A